MRVALLAGKSEETVVEGFYDSPLSPPPHPHSRLRLVYTLLRDYAAPRHPLTPSAATPRAKSCCPSAWEGNGRPGAKGQGAGGGWVSTMPLHCTGWGSLLRTRRAGDLGANARNRSNPSSPSNPCTSDTGVQCTVQCSFYYSWALRARCYVPTTFCFLFPFLFFWGWFYQLWALYVGGPNYSASLFWEWSCLCVGVLFTPYWRAVLAVSLLGCAAGVGFLVSWFSKQRRLVRGKWAGSGRKIERNSFKDGARALMGVGGDGTGWCKCDPGRSA